MAYIPDDAIDLSSQLTPSAFRLYCLVCRRRNHKTGYALLSQLSIQNSLQLSRGQTWRAITELKKLQWITANEPYFVPLFGDFTPTDRRAQKRADPAEIARNDAPAERNFAHDMRKNAPEHLYALPASENQRFSTTPPATKKSRGWFCQKCKNAGVIFREFSDDARPCPDCQHYRQPAV